MAGKIIAFCTGGSGGIGKSSGARAISQALGNRGLSTVLVDGNPGQQSQREYFQQPDALGIDVFHEGTGTGILRDSLVFPDQLPGNPSYALLVGPLSENEPGIVSLYLRVIYELYRAPDIDAIIIDCDRIDAGLWNDDNTLAGGVIRPMCSPPPGLDFARIIYRVGTMGSQPKDGFRTLRALRTPDGSSMGRNIVVLGAVPSYLPHDMRPTRQQWEEYVGDDGTFLGADEWTEASGRLLAEGDAGYPPDHEPGWLKRTVNWLHRHPAPLPGGMR